MIAGMEFVVLLCPSPDRAGGRPASSRRLPLASDGHRIGRSRETIPSETTWWR